MDREIDFRWAPPIVQTCIGMVDDPHKTIVREDGSLNYGYEMERIDIEEQTKYAERVTQYHDPTDDLLGFRHRLKPRFTHRDTLVDRSQTYGDPEAAIVTTTEEYDESTLSWTTFAHETSDGTRVDIVRWTMSADEGFGRAPSRVELRLTGDREGLPTIIETPGTTEFWTDEATQLPGLDHYAFLKGEETREGAFAVVLDGDLNPETVTLEWADDALESAREYWSSVEPFQNAFSVPDDDVMAMLSSCGRNILQAREEINGVLEYQVGPTEYRGLWIADGYFFLYAAHLMGRGEEAFETGILAIQRHTKPDGSIQILPKHTKETAIAMATFVRQCELMDDTDRLRELWGPMQRALEYLEGEHERAAAMGEDYLANRLFPPAFIDGGISGPFPEYSTPLCVLWGVLAAARAGERLDLPEHERFREFYEEIRESFEETAERDRRETADGIPYLPMNMVEREYDNPQSASTTLGLAAYPGEVFDPDSRYITDLVDLLDSIDDAEGIPANTGWMHDQGLFTYAAARYAQMLLYAGESEKAVEYLYGFANHAAPNRTWREEQALRDTHSGEWTGDMPHNWASVEFISLVRSFVCFEAEGGLRLLQGLPEEWLPTDDEALVLESTPTRHGTVDVEIRAADEGYRLNYERSPGHVEPASVSIHWDGAVSGVDVDPTHIDGSWRIPADCESATLRLRE